MRIAIGIEYDGSAFLGWQRLAHGPTVQAAVEAALSRVAAQPIRVVAAGRTDAGVHALCQVAHFDTGAERSERAWTLGGTAACPPGIAIRWARVVSERFHARRSAIRRRYRYRLLNRPVRPALSARELAWERVPLDLEAMRAGAALLLGNMISPLFAALPARRLRRAVSSRVSRSCAGARRSSSISRPTPFFTTWFAISSALCSSLAAASDRRNGLVRCCGAATEAEPDQRPRRVGWSSWVRVILPALASRPRWNGLAMRTRVKFCGSPALKTRGLLPNSG